jgi:hypothetical protein
MLKYINTSDTYILGYDFETLKRNNYLIEILQKYKSSYLFHELKDLTASNKLIDMFNMRDINLSNKQVVGIIKYFSKTKSLDISIYRDYIIYLNILSLKLNKFNLLNKNYEGKHQKLSTRIADIKQKNKDLYIKNAYRGYESFEKDGIFIGFPTKQRDLNEESICLCHCVRGYANKIIDRKLKIFFVRVDPGVPFITAEVKKGKITQFRGLNNVTTHIEPKLLNKARSTLENYIGGIKK